MTRTASSLIACSFLLALSNSAHALNTPSFISANGNDANPCTRPLPCRTLQRAHDETNPGGEINMLDPAGYGTVVITKAISIVNDGVGSAGILVPSDGVGITISAGANDAVKLRGLIIEGAGVGHVGIAFNTGKSLTIENSVVRNFAHSGIGLSPNASSSLAVSNTLVADNSAFGIFVQPTGNGKVDAVFNRVEAYNNGRSGIGVLGHVSTGEVWAIAADCVVGRSRTESAGTHGFWSFTTSGNALTVFRVFRSTSYGYETGVTAEGGNAMVSQSNLENHSGLPWRETSGGGLWSYGDNYAFGFGGARPVSKN
jgi:hypothetical protein